MRRMLLTCLLTLGIVTLAQAHFIFVVPQTGGQKAVVIFSDNLEPDTNVPIEKVGSPKLFLRKGDKDSELKWSKGEHALNVEVPGEGFRVVHGSTDYGVLQKGDSKPFLLRYHLKGIFGWSADASKPLGSKPLEIVVTGEVGKLKFKVLKAGAPLADAEVTIMAGENNEKVKTDKEGLTPAVAFTGKLGLWTRSFETASGESGGKKYDEIRHYATLVVDVPTK